MIGSEKISEIISLWSSPREAGNYTIVPTFSVYPSNSLVQAYIEGGSDTFIVSDGGGAIKTLAAAGSIGKWGLKFLRDFVQGLDVKVNSGGWMYVPNVPARDLTYAISLVAEASRDAAFSLLRHFKPVPVQDFRRDLELALEHQFHAALQKRGRLTGFSNKVHTFDYLVRVNDNTLIVMDAVLPDSSSINSAVVAHMDIRATKRTDLRQVIVYDERDSWKAADLALLTIGAPAAKYSALPKSLEKLVA